MFLISAPPQEYFILSAFKNLEIKTNQILFYKVCFGIFRPRAFGCHFKTQLTSKDTFKSQQFELIDFDGLFSFPEEYKDPPFSDSDPRSGDSELFQCV